MSIDQAVQSPSPGVIVELFEVDATMLGGEVHRFVSKATAPVLWGGEIFAPLDFETEGWGVTAGGSLPRPVVRIDNTRSLFVGLAATYNDLRTAKVTRYKTLARHLDNGAEPDPDAWLSRDVFYIDKKKRSDKRIVEFELASPLDLFGKKLPAEQVLRDWCSRRYRTWDAGTGTFVYAAAEVACPYAGTDYYDANGDICPAAEDDCGKRLSDCKLRFGEGVSLPTRACPGVALSRRTS